MNYFQQLSSWVEGPLRQFGFELTILHIDQLMDLYLDENDKSKDFMESYVFQWLVEMFNRIGDKRAIESQVESAGTSFEERISPLRKFRQRVKVNDRSIDSVISFTSKETEKNEFLNSVKALCISDEVSIIHPFDPLVPITRGSYQMFEGSPYTMIFPVPYTGKFLYDSSAIEYIAHLSSSIIGSSNKRDERKFLVAFEFIKDFNEDDKRRFYRSLIRSFFEQYFYNYNLNFENISVFMQSDSEVQIFNSVLNEIIQLLEYNSVENKFNTIVDFFKYHPYIRSKRITITNRPDSGVKKEKAVIRKVPGSLDTSELTGEIQGKVKTSSEKYRQELLKIQNILSEDFSLLLLGETGTGKSFLARTIHMLSRGKDKKNKFVELNCAAFPKDLIESELFGYEKGTHSTATDKYSGKIEFANKGTLFLDEIGKAPVNVQQKLLKVIDEKSFCPVGGNNVKKVDVRLIFALNEDPLKLIANGELLAEFYYRISELKFTIPPLRERKEDLKEFILYYKDFYEEKLKCVVDLPDDTIEYLLGLPWPGNIRQIQNSLSQALLHCKTFKIDKMNRDLMKEYIERMPDLKSKTTFREFKDSFESQFLDWYYKRNSFPKVQTLPKSKIKKKNKSHNRDSFLKSIVEPTAADIYIRNFESLGLNQDDATEIIGMSWASGKENSTLLRRARLYKNILEIFEGN